MPARKFETNSEEETVALGRQLAAELPSSGVVLLIGNLGAGKTTLAKGIAAGRIGVSPEEVSSPTFTLIHEYAPNFYHIDLYRLETELEVARLGLDELFDSGALVLIEWGERFPKLMPEDRIEVRITAHADHRTISIT